MFTKEQEEMIEYGMFHVNKHFETRTHGLKMIACETNTLIAEEVINRLTLLGYKCKFLKKVMCEYNPPKCHWLIEK
jgi:hypothetical protein